MNIIKNIITLRSKDHTNLTNIFGNIYWLFLEKILRASLGAIVGICVARYLGPEQFGALNFSMAITGFFGAVASLGLQGTAVREIVNEPTRTPSILGTTAVLQQIAGLAAYTLLIITFTHIRSNDELDLHITAILGAIILFKASEISIYWFESHVQSKYIAWIQGATFLIFSGLKVLLISFDAPLKAFAWAILAETAIASLASLCALNRCGPKLTSLRFNINQAREIMRDSWPFALSSIAIMAYMRIDQIMVGMLIGDEAVGIYSAAIQLSEAFYFVPLIIASSVFPLVLASKKENNEAYLQHLQHLYDLMVLIGIFIAIPATFLSTSLMPFLFGEQYSDSGMVLAIHIWASVFVFLGIASGKSLIAENRPLLSLQRQALGLLSNISLNLFLIPLYGTIGAALSFVISQAFSGFLYDALQKETRTMFYMKLASLNVLANIRRHVPEQKKEGL